MTDKQYKNIFEQRKEHLENWEDVNKNLLRQDGIINRICKVKRGANTKIDEYLTQLMLCKVNLKELLDEHHKKDMQIRKGDRTR